ncbi:hypothetical protein MPC1_9030002 [Methylocella tundrae]|nr:hypothetical protein MPC1_9030002 [Methylocella tundrae]
MVARSSAVVGRHARWVKALVSTSAGQRGHLRGSSVRRDERWPGLDERIGAKDRHRMPQAR